MNANRIKSALWICVLATLSLVPVAKGAAQVTQNLTAQRTSLPLPDGQSAPMWGFCRTANLNAAEPGTCGGQWTPGPTITVPVGQQLTINLTNNLPTPTSIVILGQLGGGLGTPKTVPSPAHATKTQTTWPANVAASVPFVPPTQSERVQTFGTETATGNTLSYTWAAMKAGTYLYETGTNPSIQAPMGLYGVVIVTNAPQPGTGSAPLVPGQAYPGAFPTSSKVKDLAYDADAVMLLSEIDLAQNKAVDGLCPATGTCTSIDPMAYPPAVNYAPTYFLMNGQPFNRLAPTGLPVANTPVSGNVLLRFANAGLRTHIPSVVGLNMSLVAEDGNVQPGNPKIQNEVLLTAGKTYDVLVNPPTITDPVSHITSFAAKSYGVFDRELSLSAGNTPDSGMQAFLQVAGAGLPAGVQPQVVPDSFTIPVNSNSFTGNVLTNDIAIYSAAIKSQPMAGNLTMNLDGSFTYTAVAGVSYPVTFSYCGNGSSTLCAQVTLIAGAATGLPVALPDTFTSVTASSLLVTHPGVLANDTDPSGYTLTAKADPKNALPSNISLNSDGSFSATSNGAGIQTFTYIAVNSQGTASLPAAVTVTFPTGSGLQLSVVDAQTKAALSDYRWTIEEDITFHNSLDAPTTGAPAPNTIAVNFHKSYMPVVATGCVGSISCGAGQKFSGQDPAKLQAATQVGDVSLDPAKYYYISILPGDAGNAFITGNSSDPSTCSNPSICGHTMGGVNISPGQKSATVLVEPNPLRTAQLSVFVFEDNNPTNGDIDGNEESQGLGGFQITLNDTAGRTGDPAGQITYDAFNMPLTNALMGTPDCPYIDSSGKVLQKAGTVGQTLQGMVITCPDGINPATGQRYALAGQALIKNLMPGRFDVFANPSGAREAKGEHWHQVSTLEGTHANDAFAKSGEPVYFQEFGPPGYHAFIGFVNEDNIRAVQETLIRGVTNLHSISGTVTNLHMSRPVDEALWSGSHDPIAQTTCFVGLNSLSGSGANVAFTKCDDKGNFTLSKIPDGAYQIVVWDDWLDLIIEYKNVTVTGQDVAMGKVPAFSWFTRVETSTFMDEDGTHLPDHNPGVSQVPFTVRFRDGSFSNKLVTDANGTAVFDELFPLFNWYVMESDTTRFKGSAVHVVVDGGGKPDTTLPYEGILNSKYPTGESTERYDSGNILMEGVQGFINQTQITDWGKTPYAVGENGGINGTVVYSSTRPFDDPRFLFQNLWEPLVPRVTVRLYQETTAPDGTQGLQFIEDTQTTSWDDTANATGLNAMKCPGQLANDPFVSQTLGSSNLTKCYDGFHNFNQVQPAVYDGRYYFTKLPNGKPLPAGKYVVEMVLPPGYELVKEEDKNILIGDAWVAPVSQQFGALTNIFILPDQAEVGEAANPGNPNNSTANLGRTLGGMQYPVCVGSLHRVPDFISLFPNSGQVAPFAGADRPLCDRKEVVLTDQMQGNADFFVFTSAHIAAHFTGMILNDAASEMNAASPDFGEKFAVPHVPVSMKDFNGVEIQRLYADQWGNFNGLTPSSWQVNVPNPAGYSPNMLISCMNDPGPIPDPKNPGQLITDPRYNPMYSNFCYTNAFMPGLTDYLDTPVLPVAAFATGYDQTDCAYPDATPAIKRVDGSAGFGPYLTTAGGTLTITALGDLTVPNPAYGGPSATTAPGNQKTIVRHYGFGTQGPQSKITIGGVDVTAGVTTWADDSITLNVPKGMVGGQLIIRATNLKSTVDAVTVTIEDRTPIRVQASAGGTIQAAIESANPGDLILVDAGTYNELAIMWKPVRLQGVGAASVIINAAKYPTNKLEQWRPHINRLFNIDAAGNQGPNSQVDPLPGQEITGGVVLLEPSVLGQEEGAGITVLAKNATVLACLLKTKNPNYASNFYCNPSRIDGISVTGGDAGGGIFVNGWAHNIEIANNRVYGNAGSFHGGIRVGVPYLEGLAGGGFGFNKNVHIHHNAITNNGTIEPNAGNSGAGGGVSMCSGADNYLLDYNFICGNFASTDGGGIGHIGVSTGAVIANNKVLFNQSYAQSNTVNGGGIAIEGETPVGTGLSLGSGDVTVDSNLIQGNFAESGSGAGIRLQSVNGAEINRGMLYQVTVTNNMIVNNVAGLAGAGVALADTLNSAIINNTIASNDSVGIVGALFTVAPTTAKPNPAGVSSEPTSPQLSAVLSRTLLPANRKVISNPELVNNIIWQNRSFFFDAFTGTAQECASNNLADAVAHNCNAGSPAYWDLGVVGDPNATPGANHLNPLYSVLTSTTGYDASNKSNNPAFLSPYFNASTAAKGLLLPPQAYAAFATLDEGGNFVDLTYGPLTVTGDYRVAPTSPAIDVATASNASSHDFFGTVRPQGAGFDIGAYEYAAAPQMASLTPGLLAFGNVQLGQTSAAQVATLTNTSTVPVSIASISFGTALAQYSQTNNCGTSLAVGASCSITIVLKPTLLAGPRNTSLKVVDGAGTQTVTLTGNGTAPSGTLTPTSLAFSPPSTKSGTVSAPKVVTLSNTGYGPLNSTVSFIGAASTQFKLVTPSPATACGTTLAAGANCTFNVVFAPTSTGSKSATMVVNDGLGFLGLPQIVSLSGTGN
jgi:FtsP/CotA-like multicopper oxidase with cupredoxin domain